MINLTETANKGEGFRKYFEIVPALSEVQREAAFHLRHKVYCEELGWEPTRNDAKEIDDFDSHSLHCLAYSFASGNFVGYLRLVLARPGNLLHPFPFEYTCAKSLDSSVIDLETVSRDRIAEVSRLAIVGQYRRRRGEEKTPGNLQEGSFGTPDQPRFPYLLVGLYMAVFAMAQRHGLSTLFVLVEPRLASHLNKVGITNVQIGSCVEHRGQRLPAMMDVNHVISHLNPMLRSIFDIVNNEIDLAYNAAGVVVSCLDSNRLPTSTK